MRRSLMLQLQFFLACIFGVFACDHASMEMQKAIQPLKIGEITFPSPKFDVDIVKIVNGFEKKYDAEAVVIARPIRFVSNQDYSYWIKVEILNPDFGTMSFHDFGREVAREIIVHLGNYEQFEKIEVRVVLKKGFIISISEIKSEFFEIDSFQ